jgi:hypothetical protein
MMKFHAGFVPAVLACVGGVATLTSCNRPETEVGLDLQSTGDLLSAYQTDTVLLDAVSFEEVSLETTNLTTGLLGKMHHPDFGWHTGSFATQIRLSAPDVDFGENALIDSVYVSLKYTGGQYGRLSPQNIQVFELQDSLRYDTTYYSNTPIAIIEDNLADPGFQPIVMNPNQELYFGNDTVAPELRIYLRDDFGQRLLDAGTDPYSSNDSWGDYFAGIMVRPAPWSNVGEGAVGLDLFTGLSVVRMHYHNDTDTLVYDFTINPLAMRVNLFEHQWQGDLLSYNLPDTATVDGTSRLSIFSGAGSKLRLRFPNLDDFNLDPERAINQAELWLPVKTQGFLARYPLPENLFFLTKNADGDLVSTPDQNSIGLNINGNYDPVRHAYRFNISQTVQQMLNGTLASDELYIVSSRAGVSFQGVQLCGTESVAGDTATVPQRTRLVLTYSH